jgi:hypothetical protein
MLEYVKWNLCWARQLAKRLRRVNRALKFSQGSQGEGRAIDYVNLIFP